MRKLRTAAAQTQHVSGAKLPPTEQDSAKPRVNGSLRQPTATRMPKVVNCSWLGCEFQALPSEYLTTHLDVHASDALKLWRHPSRCLWQGCSSKAVLKTLKSYQQHLINIHTRPLVCDVSGCLYKKPFRDVADLSRHKVTIHFEDQQYACPYDDCEAEIRTFARKDKVLKHIREVQHINDAFCPFSHCERAQLRGTVPFQTRKEISGHFSESHQMLQDGGYECDLGSCSNTDAKGQWTVEGLQNHLSMCHGVYYPWSPSYIMKDAGQKIFLLEDLKEAQRKLPTCNFFSWHDCTICAPSTAQRERYTITLEDEDKANAQA